MATRAMRANSVEHVQALNSIEVFFNDKTNNDKAVREAWRLYLDFYYSAFPRSKQTQKRQPITDKASIFLLVYSMQLAAH